MLLNGAEDVKSTAIEEVEDEEAGAEEEEGEEVDVEKAYVSYPEGL